MYNDFVGTSLMGMEKIGAKLQGGGSGAIGGLALAGALAAGAAAAKKQKDKDEFFTKPKNPPNPELIEKKGLTPLIPIVGGNPVTDIPDGTNNNLSQNIGEVIEDNKSQQEENKISAQDQINETLQRQWEREDQIRKETQEREDSAWQRSIRDAKLAGINVNLANITPAESGGGIMQTAQPDYAPSELELNQYLKELEAYLNNEIKVEEGQKDRIATFLNKILTTVAMMYMMKR